MRASHPPADFKVLYLNNQQRKKFYQEILGYGQISCFTAGLRVKITIWPWHGHACLQKRGKEPQKLPYTVDSMHSHHHTGCRRSLLPLHSFTNIIIMVDTVVRQKRIFKYHVSGWLNPHYVEPCQPSVALRI